MPNKKSDKSICAICGQAIYHKHGWFHRNLATDADHWPELVIPQKVGVIPRLLSALSNEKG